MPEKVHIDGQESLKEVSGLDMGPTISWYRENQEGLVAELENLCQGNGVVLLDIEDMKKVQLSPEMMRALLAKFPENARERSVLRKILGKEPAWFRKDSLSAGPAPTGSLKEALSPTAIIPSYVDNAEWVRTGEPSMDMWLFEIPYCHPDITPEVATIILAEGFVHEVSHSISMPLVFSGDRRIVLPTGRIVDGADVIADFYGLTRGLPPISHYSSTYRDAAGGYPEYDPENPLPFKIAVDEELAESVAAYLLGFTFCEDEERRLSPFIGRPGVRAFVEQFLQAQTAE